MDRVRLSNTETPIVETDRKLPQAADANGAAIKTMLRVAVAQENAPVVPGHITSSIFAAVLDLMTCPVLVIDRSLHIHHANTAAEIALQAGGVLSRKDKQLAIEPPSLAFVDTVGAATRGGKQGKHSMILSGTGRQSVAVWLQPFETSLQSSDGIWSRGLVVLTFGVLPSKPRLSANLLCEHYALTRKEAEVACHLACGLSLRDIVAKMKIKRSTARSHLAKCFTKTGTRRQPDLVALVLSLASPMLE